MISGTLFSYSYLCHKKVWYFYHGINLESENQNVKIGKLIDEKTYSRESKHFMINNSVNIDFFKENTVFEIKKKQFTKRDGNSTNQILFILFEKILVRRSGRKIANST